MGDDLKQFVLEVELKGCTKDQHRAIKNYNFELHKISLIDPKNKNTELEINRYFPMWLSITTNIL